MSALESGTPGDLRDGVRVQRTCDTEVRKVIEELLAPPLQILADIAQSTVNSPPALLPWQDPTRQVWKNFNATSAQTGISIWAPAPNKRIAITNLIIGSYATTAARLILWFGSQGDTTYSAGTDQLVFAASFTPSTSATPGAVENISAFKFAQRTGDALLITTDANLSVDVTVYGYEFVQ